MMLKTSHTTFVTPLPKNIAYLRIGLALAITALYASIDKHPLWRWGITTVGVAYASYTAYLHLRRRDPLVEAFYKIVGGEEKFLQLPEIKFEDALPLSKYITSISW